MGIKHPTYPFPTIKEALCEIHFGLREGETWRSAIFGEFFNAVQADFPEMEPVQQYGFQLLAGPTAFEHKVIPPRQMVRYTHKDRKLLMQLAEGTLTVNILPVYEGWQTMQKSVLDAWGRVMEVIRPSIVRRIGLRYIDFIPRERPEETPGDWLRESEYLPKAVLRSLTGFLSRTEMKMDPETRLVVALGEAEDQPPAVVLDVDCIVEKQMGTDTDSIARETQRLHDLESEVFFASLTPRLERKLKGEV